MITDALSLPPGFVSVPAGADAFAAALADADAGGDPGRIHWGERGGACAAAIVLAPDRPVSADALRDLVLLALYDAIASVAPPQVPIDVVLPGTLLVDGGQVGAVRVAMSPGAALDAMPDWTVAGFTVALRSELADPGEAPGETSLAEEGFEAVTAADVLGPFCRHLLVWIEAWREEGEPGLARALRHRVVRAVPA